MDPNGDIFLPANEIPDLASRGLADRISSL
jgi:hypothetical protein